MRGLGGVMSACIELVRSRDEARLPCVCIQRLMGLVARIGVPLLGLRHLFKRARCGQLGKSTTYRGEALALNRGNRCSVEPLAVKAVS